MVDTFGMAGMLVVALFALAAIYVIMRLLDRPAGEEGDEEKGKPISPPKEGLGELSDEEFVDSYTGPMLEDARETLDTAVESIRSGLYYYGRGAWEEASGEFHAAIRPIDRANDRLREVAGLVEDPGSKPVKAAKALQARCLRMRAMAIRMEEASDAMVAGRDDEARKHASVKDELERMVSDGKAP